MGKIQFEDKKVSIIDIIPIKYILEALKYPGQVLDYSQVITAVSGANEALDINQDYSQMSQEQLEEEGVNIDNISYDDDTQRAFAVLQKLSDTGQWKALNKGISIFEQTYEAKVIPQRCKKYEIKSLVFKPLFATSP